LRMGTSMLYSPRISRSLQWASMDTLTAGSMMGILIILQMAIIRECIKMKGHVSENSTDLKTELTNLGILLDEAIDFLVDGGGKPSPLIAQAGDDLRSTLLTAFMSRMMMAPEHGTTQSEERSLYPDNTQTLETGVQRIEGSGDVHHQ